MRARKKKFSILVRVDGELEWVEKPLGGTPRWHLVLEESHPGTWTWSWIVYRRGKDELEATGNLEAADLAEATEKAKVAAAETYLEEDR